MTIYFGGGEMASFTPSDGNATESTYPGRFDSEFARCAISTGTFGITGTYIASAALGGLSDFWLHFNVYGVQQPPSVGGPYQAVLVMSGASGLVRLTFYGTGGVDSSLVSVQPQYNASGTWTNIGSAFTYNCASVTPFDMHIVTGGSGSVTVYLNGGQRATGTAAITGTADTVRLQNPYITQHWSEVIVASESTIGWRLKTVPPAGDGAATDWVGTYADIDETVYSDVDFNSSATANQVQLYSHATTFTGQDVLAIIVTNRAKKAAGGPESEQLALKSGATTYLSSTRAQDYGMAPNVAVWATNPNGGVAWTPASAAAIQYGQKSIT